MLFAVLEDFCEGDAEQLPGWLEHIGFDVSALADKRADFWTLYTAHYRLRPGRYDISKMLRDLTTWGPIASRIVELQMDQAEKS